MILAHSLGIEPRARHSNLTSITIRLRTHRIEIIEQGERVRVILKDKKDIMFNQ